MFDNTFVALDIETTGTAPGNHEIIEIGAVKISDRIISEKYQTLIKPNREIPTFIQNLTGINNEMVEDAPDLNQVLPQLKKFIGERTIVGHNIAFDLSFINHHLKVPLKNNSFDTWVLSRIFMPMAKSHSLAVLTDMLAIEQQQKHRALDDARATAELLLNLFQTIDKLDIETHLTIKNIIGEHQWPYKVLFETLVSNKTKQFPASKLTNSFVLATKEIDSEGLFSESKDVKIESTFPVTLDYKHFKKLLSPSGIMAEKFPGFESRPQQEKILLDTCRVFNENKFLLMEAGTGTGKSLAYLLPSIYWSFYNREKVVIATHTINLQEQLWAKDIPLLKNILNNNFKAALIKGRNNYICLRKWDNKLKDNNFSTEEMIFYLRLLVWLKNTLSGDKSELNLIQPEKEVWESLCADSDTCLGIKCPWYERYCFVKRARRGADAADLLIINHSLLFSDIKTDNRLLPPYNYLVIDEAHHLEDEATDNLCTEVSSSGLNRLLNTLHKNNDGSPGLVYHLKNAFNKHLYAFETKDYQQVLEELDKATENIYLIKDAVTGFFNILSALRPNDKLKSEETFKFTHRLRTNIKDSPAWVEIENQRANLHTRITYLIENMKKIVNIIERQVVSEDELLSGEKRDILAAIGNLREVMSNIDLIVYQEEKNHVYWMESGPNFCAIKAAPIDVGEILFGNLLQNKKTIVFTSATLAVDGDFTHFMERVGLDNFEAEKFIRTSIESPFNYEKQALLCAVKDLPEPTAVDEQTYIEAIVPFLINLLQITKGRTLVLFTAHKMLKDVYNRIKPLAEKQNINLLGHGIDGGRNRIINQFKEFNNSVLFGANSFWEGIDLPGDLLNCVVIVKIPFWPPDIPTIEARLDDLAAKEVDGFWNYTVPQAVIRLKQGFGRLIRTQKDRGVVVILDNRIISKKYGYKFLRSLPLKRHFKGEKDIVLQKISDWFTGEAPEFSLITYDSKELIDKFLSKHKQQK